MVISSDLLRGYTDAIILRCLIKGDGYGYQISKEVFALSGGKLELKEATLYTAFRRMETSGYIRSYWGDENIGARRRYYSLTDEGRNKLTEETKAWRETRNVMNKLLEGDRTMNATICGMIDVLFKDTVDTIETRTMREELLNNCLEHYNDLISRGLSETEAIDAVVESLNGMKEVIDEYPKKPDAEKKEEPVQEPEEEFKSFFDQEQPEEEVPADRIYSSDDIRSIRTNLRSNDITVGRSSDGLIHVRCEEPKQLICTEEGNRLSIRVDSEWQKIGKDKNLKPDEMSMKGILSFVGKVLSKVASDISTAGAEVFIDLPEKMDGDIDLNSMSGDIEVSGCSAPKMTLHSTSGDISYAAPDDADIDRISASSASGDIHISCNAKEAEGSSISGDVIVNGDFRNAKIKSTSGSIRLNGCAREIYAHTVSGSNNVTLQNTDARRIDAASTSGNVNIELPAGTPSVHANRKSVSGSTRCSFADAGNGAQLQINASTVSGSVRIQ